MPTKQLNLSNPRKVAPKNLNDSIIIKKDKTNKQTRNQIQVWCSPKIRTYGCEIPFMFLSSQHGLRFTEIHFLKEVTRSHIFKTTNLLKRIN